MGQDHSYPDPVQLRAFAAEPLPFTEIEGIDPRADGHLVGHSPDRTVEYDYRPSYIRFTPETGDVYEVSQHADATLDHAGCWTRADDIEVTEDFVCATGLTGDMVPEFGQFEAFWVLDELTISVPD